MKSQESYKFHLSKGEYNFTAAFRRQVVHESLIYGRNANDVFSFFFFFFGGNVVQNGAEGYLSKT